MIIENEESYRRINERIDELIDKGTKLGDMELLSEREKKEFNELTDAAYDWECQTNPHPWTVESTLITAIKKAVRKLGLSKKEAAETINMSPSNFEDVLNGKRGITYSEARDIHHNLNIPANIILA